MLSKYHCIPIRMPEPSTLEKQKTVSMESVVSLGFIYIVLGLVTVLYPLNIELSFLDKTPKTCPLRIILNLRCSFCGMTHAWIYFWHGEWVEAWHENALSIVLFLGFPFYLIVKLRSDYWTDARNISLIGTSILTLVIYTISRNVLN